MESFLKVDDTQRSGEPEIIKKYREKTIGIIETILKRVFSSDKGAMCDGVKLGTVTTSAPYTSSSNLPEIFARRGNQITINNSPSSVQSEVPLIFEFGPLIKNYSIGKLLINYWTASRKVYPIEKFENLKLSIKSIENFISASFIEDENGQVQLFLPKILENTFETIKRLENLLECQADSEYSYPSAIAIDAADKQIEIVLSLLKEMLQKISFTFGDTLENVKVKVSSECRNYLDEL